MQWFENDFMYAKINHVFAKGDLNMVIKMNIIHNSHPQYRFNNFHIWNGKKPFLISLSYFHVYKWSERSMWF